MKFRLKSEWLNILIILVMFIAGILSWSTAPEKIPTHWNMQGEADGYSSKGIGLFVFPVVALVIYIFSFFLPKIDPARKNYEQFKGAYYMIRFLILIFFAVIYSFIHLSIRNIHFDVNQSICIAVGVLFLVFGNFMGKIRPNWFVGIRTPWTLSSKTSWIKTHRFSGWLFGISGLCVIIFAVLFSAKAPYSLIIFGGIAGLGSILYSYLVWRKATDKVIPFGTVPSDDD